MNAYRYAFQIAYTGTSFCGWQKQLDAPLPSIQSTLTQALNSIHQAELSVQGSGRTDAGVHSLGQIVHADLPRLWQPGLLIKAINSLLPLSVRVLECQLVQKSFHAQRSAIKKQYSYFLQQGRSSVPHLYPFSWWIQRPLDIEAMQAAAEVLVGEHDFAPFMAAGSNVKSTVRTILDAKVEKIPIPFPNGAFFHSEYFLVRIQLIGTGFLKQMVRGITGTLVPIGEGRLPKDRMSEIMTTKNRSLLGTTAPPRGLWLEKVWYSPNPFDL